MNRQTRREFLSTIGKGAAAFGLLGASGALTPADARAASAKKTNVLFIAVDDLRPQLGCYGNEQMISPNIDRLAARGVRFDRAYCQQAVCAPSRASLLSGARPDTTKIYDLNTPLRSVMPNVLSLPQHFKNHGYETISLGKIYHHSNDDAVGWSNRPARPQGDWKGRGYLDPASVRDMQAADAAKKGPTAKRGIGPAFEGPDVPDGAYGDGKNTELAIAELRRFAESGKPFFLALGYYKPHLPFNAPKKYWDMYPPRDIQLPANTDAPADAPSFAMTGWGELRQYTGIPKKGRCSDELAGKLIRGYYACVTYVDTLIGRLLGELKDLGLADNTVIVLWGDHGWKLGEYGSWCKHTNFELDTHVPMLFAGPGVKGGQSTRALTEFVDIYPTLAELCGLAVPAHCEGTSLVPLFADPKRPWKSAAFSQYPRGKIMGYSMRTDRYRYTRWIDSKTGEVAARELYDHKEDPGENCNLASKPANAALVKKLDAQSAAGWKAAKPKG